MIVAVQDENGAVLCQRGERGDHSGVFLDVGLIVGEEHDPVDAQVIRDAHQG